MSHLLQLYPCYGVGYICSLFGKSRQSWYEQQKLKAELHLSSAFVLKLVNEIRQELPRVGVMKLHAMLQPRFSEHGIKLGRDGLYALLRHHGYLLKYKRNKLYTTDSNHRYKKYANLIAGLILNRAGQLWVSDITYIRLSWGFCYLSIIVGAYSRKLVGYHLHPTLHSDGAVSALTMAIKDCNRSSTLIHHSDRGSQYCCREYVRELQKHHIRISMTENGDPYENAIAERVNGILKHEFGLAETFSTFDQAVKAVTEAAGRYNTIRPHASCDYLTPVLAHQHNGLLRKRWKQRSYKLLNKSMSG